MLTARMSAGAARLRGLLELRGLRGLLHGRGGLRDAPPSDRRPNPPAPSGSGSDLATAAQGSRSAAEPAAWSAGNGRGSDLSETYRCGRSLKVKEDGVKIKTY